MIAKRGIIRHIKEWVNYLGKTLMAASNCSCQNVNVQRAKTAGAFIQ
jgi:hypothetical protein